MENRMTAQQLKNSILQMAVQGKLVSQDPNDEPASVLLERIRKEKEQLIKDGKIKKNKKESYIFRGADNLHYEQIGKEVKCIEDELPFEIPDSWEWVRLNEIRCKEIKRGKSPTYITNSNIFVFAQKCNSKYNGIDLSLCKCLDPAKFRNYDRSEVMLPGDIIINSTGTGTLGRIGYLSGSDNINNLTLVPDSHVTVVRLSNELNSYFMKVTVNLYHKYFEEHGEGSTNQKELKPLTIQTILVPIPPRNEQNRIVNKLKELKPLIEKYKLAEEKLYELNSNIKNQLKKSILQYAIEGKLVPQDPNDEPASVLLDRIRKEKQTLIAEGKIKKDKNESIIYRRDNSYYEMLDKKVNCIDDKILFEIPNSWEWIRISSMASIVTKGTTPRGGNVAYQDYGIGFLRAENIAGFNKLNLSNLNYINKETHFGYLKRSILEANDILITIAGTLGRTAIVQEKDLPLNTNQAIAIVRLIPSISINYDYLIYAVNSPVIQKSLISQRKITAIPNLTLEMISECLIPIPPLKEQNRIIDKIQEIEYLCTKLIVK